MNSFQIKNTNSQILIETAQQMGIKVKLLDEEKLKLRLTKNKKSHIVTKNSFCLNSSKAIALTRNKQRVSVLLKKNNIQVPEEVEIHSLSELKNKQLPSFPLVLKPSEGQKAHDVFVGIRNQETLIKTVKKIFEKYDSLIIQEFIKGKDLRFFVLNEKVIGIAQRHPPTLTGDGKNTIKQLILNHNQRLLDDRQKTGKRMQNRLLNQQRIIWHIQNQGLQLNTILPQGKTITVYPISNFQAGGTVETIPLSKVHPTLIKLAEKISSLTKLKVCGIDMITTRTGLVKQKQSLNDINEKSIAYFIEINSDPSLRLHEWPNKGTPQPITEKLLEFIFSSSTC